MTLDKKAQRERDRRAGPTQAQIREADRIRKQTKRAEAKQQQLKLCRDKSEIVPAVVSDQNSLPIVQVPKSCQRCKDFEKANLEKLQDKNKEIEQLEKDYDE